MTRFSLFALALVALVAIGCKSNYKRELADVPPPPPGSTVSTSSGVDSAEGIEPVTVNPVDPGVTGDVVVVEDDTLVMDDATTSAAPVVGVGAGQSTTYTVKKGDTLWGIAQKHYGSGQKWVAIVDANPGINPKKLIVGQSIVLP